MTGEPDAAPRATGEAGGGGDRCCRECAGCSYVAAVLVLLAGFQLFVFTDRTASYFAWTIRNPLAAAFLGAGYRASVAFEALAARQRIWANARIAVPDGARVHGAHPGGHAAATWASSISAASSRSARGPSPGPGSRSTPLVPLLMVIILAVQLADAGR